MAVIVHIAAAVIALFLMVAAGHEVDTCTGDCEQENTALLQHRTFSHLDGQVESLHRDDPKPAPTTADKRATTTAAADAVVTSISGITDWAGGGAFPIAEVGTIITDIGTACSFMVPPPAGLVAGGVLGVVGGVLGLFDNSQPEPSNQDLLDAMNSGFEEIQKTLGQIQYKLESMDAELQEINVKLDLLVDKVVKFLELQEQTIRDITSAHIEITHLQERANTSHGFETYSDYVRKAAQDYRASRNGRGALSPENVRQVLVQLDSTTPVGLCDIGEFYKSIISARYSLFFILALDGYMKVDTTSKTKEQINAERLSEIVYVLQELQEDLEQYTQIVGEEYGSTKANVSFYRWEYPVSAQCAGACLASDCTLAQGCVGMTTDEPPRMEGLQRTSNWSMVVTPQGFVTNGQPMSSPDCKILVTHEATRLSPAKESWASCTTSTEVPVVGVPDPKLIGKWILTKSNDTDKCLRAVEDKSKGFPGQFYITQWISCEAEDILWTYGSAQDTDFWRETSGCTF